MLNGIRDTESATPHRKSDGQVARIIVTVAPVAHVGTFLPAGCRNPITPAEIAEEARRCEGAGASVVHLHVRDKEGIITSGIEVFGETLDRVCGETRLIVNGSTGGASDLTREERCISVTDPRVELASLNMGSTNFGTGVYINTVEDIRYWAGRLSDARVVPELEVFGSAMIKSGVDLRAEGVIPEAAHFNVCLGFPGAAPATPAELCHMAGQIPPGPGWGFLHEGMIDLRLVGAALGLGATGLRVGYEDGGYLRPDRVARSNAELVELLVQLIRAAGCEPATPEEARAILHTKGRQVRKN